MIWWDFFQGVIEISDVCFMHSEEFSNEYTFLFEEDSFRLNISVWKVLLDEAILLEVIMEETRVSHQLLKYNRVSHRLFFWN